MTNFTECSRAHETFDDFHRCCRARFLKAVYAYYDTISGIEAHEVQLRLKLLFLSMYY